MKKIKNKESNQQKPKTAQQHSLGSNIAFRLIITLLVLVVYLPSVNFEFTLDDDIFYQKHASVQQGLSGIGEFFTYGSMFKFDGTTGVQPYRPITLLSFAEGAMAIMVQ